MLQSKDEMSVQLLISIYSRNSENLDSSVKIIIHYLIGY